MTLRSVLELLLIQYIYVLVETADKSSGAILYVTVSWLQYVSYGTADLMLYSAEVIQVLIG